MRPSKLLWAIPSATFHASRNLVFRRAPRVANALLRLGNVSGRGGAHEGPRAVDYFHGVVSDYEQIATHTGLVPDARSLFRGRRVLELGPGDTRSVALLARLRGARLVEGFDAFDITSRDERYLRGIYEPLMERDGEPGGFPRAKDLLRDVRMHPDRASLRAAEGRYDLVISRAVLEHVTDLDALFDDLARVTTPDAVQVHKVDLRCHGNKFDHELDFLMFPEAVYRAMASHTGMPNRVRVGGYLDLGARHGFALVYAGATHRISVAEVNAVRDQLAPPYDRMAPEALAVLGVWIVLVGKNHPLATKALKDLTTEALPVAPAEILSPF
jgi:SAM-dependent methyltransferase